MSTQESVREDTGMKNLLLLKFSPDERIGYTFFKTGSLKKGQAGIKDSKESIRLKNYTTLPEVKPRQIKISRIAEC